MKSNNASSDKKPTLATQATRSGEALPERGVRPLRSAKIQDRHLQRLAVVYVRQSTPQQVLDHQESRARQYALADHAVTLGWPKDRVLVIDEDQGQSGRSVEQRDGFKRLLTEVTLGHVGLVLGLEMSRLARSSKDWHNLLEVCGLFATLLGDQDGVYNPNDTNDRLLLGLKGTMSEYEMFTMRNRLQFGRLHKAQRGEVYIAVPCGYLKLPSGQVILDPDEQARAVVQMVFDKFDELGSQYGVLHYLIRNNLRIGIRLRFGARRGELEWRRPSMSMVSRILHHPMYAGAYVFGRHKRLGQGASARRKRLPMAEWQVLKHDHLPAYITWEKYLSNQQRLQANRHLPTSAGVPRQGAALLSSLLICGTCGRRMQPNYGDRANPVYGCDWHQMEARMQTCHSMKASVIDDLVAQQVLRALEPAALELSLQAEADVDKERQRLHRHWQKQLERARYEVERAERQFQAVEPENRLVARTLEQRWEETLRQQRQVQEEHDRFLQDQPAQLSADERQRIRELSNDMPGLWHAPATMPAERKEIIRCLVEKVVVHVQKDSEYVDATIHWQGGFTSQHELVRPVANYAHMRDFQRLCERLVEMRKQGFSAAQMADKLNQEGFSPPKRRSPFSAELVRQLLCRQGISNEKACTPPLAEHEWLLPDLARELKMPAGKLRGWIERGWLHGRQTPAQHLWIAWADRDELRRLRKLIARSHRGVTSQPVKLTTPKNRSSR
jgi:DNA invertase Pin-like site-specific DNA recombinase